MKGSYDAEIRKRALGTIFQGRAEELILQQVQVTFPTLELITDAVRMTPRTVQRKLRVEGTNFKAVSGRLKSGIAPNLLANADLNIADSAYKLGRLGSTSFQRACNQWTGTNPSEFRKRLGA